MKMLRLIFAGLAIAMMTISTANARDSFSVGINIGSGHGQHVGYHVPVVRYYYAPKVRYYHAPRASYYSRHHNRGAHHYKQYNRRSHYGYHHRRYGVKRGHWKHNSRRGHISRHSYRGHRSHRR